MRGNPSLSPLLVGCLLAAITAVAIYALSVGPVFAYYCRHDDFASVAVCQCYWPLFRVAPALTAAYVNWWGVSDLEAFFLLQPVSFSASSYDLSL
jgi:hypothetical protein